MNNGPTFAGLDHVKFRSPTGGDGQKQLRVAFRDNGSQLTIPAAGFGNVPAPGPRPVDALAAGIRSV
jgi:hypothetical protein